MPSRFLAELDRRVLVADGGMGTAIHEFDLSIDEDYLGCENCPEVLLKTHPDLIEKVHRTFLEVGSDAVETDSFGAAVHVLREFDLHEESFDLAKRAAEVARAACDAHSTKDKPRFVLGSLGPGTKLLTLGQIEWDDMLASYKTAASGLIAGGADALLIETCQDIQQVKCVINACLAALDDAGRSHEDIPIMVSVTIETMGTMLMGTSIEGALAVLENYPVASLGLNCATGPTEMGEYIQHVSRHWDRNISVLPNAGLPVLVEGRTEYPLKPEPFADALEKFIDEYGINLVGGCCGTTPEHLRVLADRVAGRSRPERTHTPIEPACTSLYGPVEYRQDNATLYVGERMNASGSRRFKRLLEAEDWDGILSLAKNQMREGSHLLDLNVDYAGRDNAGDMAEITQRVVRQVDAPLMIDSTQVQTIEAGLKKAPGKCIINSANFEDGQEKFDEICRLARTYGAGLVIGAIDEDKEAAMARTADRKHAIATRAIERARDVHGFAVHDLFIDPLVLPISTGMDDDRRSAAELIEGVRRIAESFPDVQLTCGLSNASFGLKPAARQVLNSMLLHELVDAGMTSAIVHASGIIPLSKIEPEHRQAALDLIYDRRAQSRGGTGLPEGVDDESFDPLQAFIDLFKDVNSVAETKQDMSSLPVEERLRRHIIDGEKENLHASLDEAMQTYAPLDIINDHLLDGMKTVGELFGAGEMQLPFVLQSAEVMKMAVAHLEPHMERAEGDTKGSIVLATVKGDVHDIGKNLVDIILTNNGYTVHNIGIKQTVNQIVEAWRKTNANAIGLSGLLVKSVNVMEDNLREFNELGIDVPVILGGAALSRTYAEGHLRSIYEGQTLYGKDAFEGLRLMDHIAGGSLDAIQSEIDERTRKRSAAEETIARSRAKQGDRQDAFERSKQQTADGAEVAVLERSKVATDVPVPEAPFLGARVVEGIPLDDIYPFINPTALFRGQWQFKKGKLTDDQYQAMLEDKVLPTFERLKAWCRDERVLEPKVVYGYFRCNSSGNDLIIYHPDDDSREIERFTFPRQDGKKHLCISDFFRDASSGQTDLIAMHCVTMGPRVTDECKRLFDSNKYDEYLYLHGMGVETAEALAEMWHKRIRQELGIAGDDSPKIKELFRQSYRGSRYSFGYPACPDMSDQDKLWKLLEPERIGCTLTENWQIDPEQSTSAIVVHHPEAKYFNV